MASSRLDDADVVEDGGGVFAGKADDVAGEDDGAGLFPGQ